MKFLVMGLGSIGLRHARNLLAMGHEVYGYDIDKGVLAGAVEHGVRWWESDHSACDIQCCLVASPTACHAMDIARAAKRGWPTFVEKPIAASMKELENVDTSHVLMVGNMLRFHPLVNYAKSRIGNPIFGVFNILQRNSRPEYLRDGVLLNWGAHEIDLALYMLGPAELRSANVYPDQAVVDLHHVSGAGSRIIMDYVTEPEKRDFEIHHSGGAITGADLRLDDWNPVYIAEMQEFVDMINGTPRQRIGASAEDGLETLKIIDEARQMCGQS